MRNKIRPVKALPIRIPDRISGAECGDAIGMLAGSWLIPRRYTRSSLRRGNLVASRI